MGSSSSEQAVGFKYFLGVHMVLAQNKLRLLGVNFGDKEGWKGNAAGGEVAQANNKELFGGQDAEGGVSGYIDVLDGDAAQAKNSYLQTAIGGVISAYRGVTSIVFRQFYFGNNPYLKRVAIKVIDNEIAASWDVGKAWLNVEGTSSQAEIMIIMDGSGSMSGAKEAYETASVAEFLESLKGSVNDVKLVWMKANWILSTQNDTVSTTIRDCDDADYDTLISWVLARNGSATGGTYYEWGFSLLPAFFTTDTAQTEFEGGGILENEGDKGFAANEGMRRICMFMTDGAPTNGQPSVDASLAYLVGYEHVDIYAFNIDDPDTQYTEQLDNTPADGVPVVSSSDQNSLAGAFTPVTTTWADLNAVHIVRDVLVRQNGGNDEFIGSSFSTVAQTLYDEGMGLSFFWRNTSSSEEFINDVKQHADIVTYRDRSTGKHEIKAIRNDYSVGALTTYDKTNVAHWHDDISRPRQNELPNQITVVYTKRRNGKEASVTATNIAALQSMPNPRIIPEKIKYMGINFDALAARVAMRDLAARTMPLLSGTITPIGPVSPNLNIGSPFIVNEPDLGIDNVVVRLTEKEEFGGKNPKTLLKFLEDKFDTPSNAIVEFDEVAVADDTPVDATYRLFEEVGYYTLVVDQGADTIDGLLTDDPDSGIIALAGSKPNEYHSAMDTATDAGAGWILINTGGFMPASTLVANLDTTDTTSFDVVDNDSLRQVVVGSLAVIDAELIRIDNMVISGDNVTLTVGRGCLDTIPAVHRADAPVLFYDGYAQHDPTTYVAAETIDGKILTKTSAGRLSLDDAATEQVTLNSRAIRPYPVNNLKMDGSFHPSGVLDASVPITWVHRDRKLQLTTIIEDYEDASIGPEAGSAYTLELRAILQKVDVFAETDVFAAADAFGQDGEGSLIRSESLVQSLSYEYDEAGVYNEFAKTDVFDSSITDVFAATAPNVFDSSITDVFNTDQLPDVFMVIGPSAIFTRILIRNTRDTYDNWISPRVQGVHLRAPHSLTGVIA